MIKHTIRDRNSGTIEVNLNLGKAVRAFCLECLGWSPDEVKRCSAPLCPLHPFRFGKDPSMKRELTEEQKAITRDRFKRNVLKTD